MAFNKVNAYGCPCGGCDERSTACHDRCQKYKDWKVKIGNIRSAERMYRESLGSTNPERKKAIRRALINQKRGIHGKPANRAK